MAAPATTNEFLDLVRKSGVAEEKRFDAWLQKAKSNAALSAAPGAVAGLLIRDGVITAFQAEQILAGKYKRFTIGKYKVLEKLGSGGMGSVYLCEHKLMRRRVAVKVLPTAKAQDESALQRFFREARAVAALDHPNIVHAYDIDQDESLHFLVMEYVDGASLQEIVKKSGPMDIPRACDYIRQSTLGLDHAHQAGLIHRDIKPGNILVDRTGVVKILDMGLARFFNDDDDVLTKKFDENVLGTADYLAPEQAIDSHDVDIRADIYSLGATFYYMLTGRTPFGEGTVAQKLLWHQNRQPKSVSEFRPEVPPGLVAIIAKMMAKDKFERYQAPAEIAAALEPFAEGAVATPPESEMPQLSPAALGGPTTGQDVSDATVVKTDASAPPKALQKMSAPGKSAAPAKSAPTPAPPSPTPAKAPAPPARSTAANAPSAPKPKPAPANKPAAAPSKPTAAPKAVAAHAPSAAVQTMAKEDAAPGSAEDEAPWESLAAVDTEDPSAKADTAPEGGKSIRALVKKAAVRDPHRAWIVFGIIGAGALVLITGLLIFIFRNTGGTPGAGRKTLDVTNNARYANSYRTVRSAMQNAQPGDVIQLMDSEHYENLHIDQRDIKDLTMDVTVQAAPGREVVWRSSRSEEAVPILTLQNARNFKVKGISFDGAIDATKRVKDLIVINFASAGLTIEDSSFRSFGHSAVYIVNAAGTRDKPIRLLNLKATATIGAQPEAVVLFEAKDQVEPPQNSFIEMSGGDFPGLNAVKEIGNAPNGMHVILQK
jgi:serine/threonine protein kinase